jgi:hypothetical protein
MKSTALLRMVLLAATASVALGCAPAASVRTIDYPPFGTAYEIRNDRATAIVVPAVGRIMEYHVDGSPNLLFVHRPDVEAYRADNTVTEPGKWHNYGGDKVWYWPQDQWPQALGRAWPPPHELDGLPWTAKAVRDGVQLTSAAVPQYGAFATRTIRLEGNGGLRQTVEVRPTAGTGHDPLPIGAWTVTQVPLPTSVVLNSAAVKDAGGMSWRLHEPVEGHPATRLVITPGRNAKAAGAGTTLYAFYANGIFTQTLMSTSEGKGDPTDRAQVYASDVGPDVLPTEQMVELEFTSPIAVPAEGRPVRLEVYWAFAPSAPR